MFGGLLLGLAIVAASRETKRCHALHAQFLAPGFIDEPFDISVEKIRDGSRFTTRRIEIRQAERLVFAAYGSHHDGDDGIEHQVPMPAVAPPETLEDQRSSRAAQSAGRGAAARRYLSEETFDTRPIEANITAAPGEGVERVIWFRPREPLYGGSDVHRAAIAFASDVGLVFAGLQRHDPAVTKALEAASLNHAIWFHTDALADDWMLHVQRAPVAAHGRGLSTAQIFARDGRLVATAAQEYLARTGARTSSPIVRGAP